MQRRIFAGVVLLSLSLFVGCSGRRSSAEPLVDSRVLPENVGRVFGDAVVGVRTSAGGGMGFFVADGLVITCRHVAEGGPKIFVVRGLIEYQADVVAIDSEADLALLRVPLLRGVGIFRNIDFLKKPLAPMAPQQFFSFKFDQNNKRWLFVKHGRFIGTRKRRIHATGKEKEVGFLDGLVEHGFSGSPVLDEQGYCRGVVFWMEKGLFSSGTGFVLADQVIDFLRRSGIEVRAN